jgi:poly-gamma-glutamate synthesis protein (capsule biosynthesis protein)
MQAGPGPGISVLHTRKITLVTPSQMNTLREIGASVGMNAESSTGPKADLCLGEQCFRVAAGSTTTGLTYTMDRDDESAVLQSIREAKQTAKAVVFAIHAHETAGGSEDPRPADFLPVLFHEAIDAGATIVIRTGPHSLQGIEVYKGKPIFYGMGSVFFTPGADGSHRLRNVELPARWYDSAVAITIFHRGKLSEIRIYPLTLVSDGGPMASTPRPAAPVDAQRILTQLQQDSLQFGTHLQVEKGVGIIRP